MILMKADQAKEAIAKMNPTQKTSAIRSIESNIRHWQESIEWALKTPRVKVRYGQFREWQKIRESKDEIIAEIDNAKRLVELLKA